MKTVLLPLLLAAALASGCSAVQTRPAEAQAVVQIATLEVIAQAADPEKRRNRVLSVISKAEQLAEDEMVSLPELVGAVYKNIDFTALSPQEEIAVRYLVAKVSAALSDRLGEGNWMTGKRLVALKQVLAWVRQGAELSA